MQTQDTKLLLFMPSPRDIPQVKKSWADLPFDKYIVKYTPEPEAYSTLREFFLEHKEYSHFAVCPDDLELNKDMVVGLWDAINKYDYPVLSGYSNIDETQPNVYCIMDNMADTESPPARGGSFFERNQLPEGRFFKVKHSGFGCQIIRRDVLEKVSWTGACNQGRGNFDWQFSKECYKLGIPIMIDSNALFYHRRRQEKDRIIRSGGYSFLITYFSC